MYHFVHLAEHFVIIQWSGRHDNRKARNKMIRSKDVQIGARALARPEDLTARF
jgi:hypothetical protein